METRIFICSWIKNRFIQYIVLLIYAEICTDTTKKLREVQNFDQMGAWRGQKNSNSAERAVGEWTSQEWGEFQVSCDSDLKADEVNYTIILSHGTLHCFSFFT